MHFCWQDRTTGIVEDDLIIFPDDCEYIKVPQCTTGRVFLLKFKSSNRKFFFWLQEPRTDKDEDHCKRINEYLNNPAGSVPSSGSNDPDLQSLLNNMSQSQLMQLFAGGQIGELSSLLGTISRPSTNTTSASSAGGGGTTTNSSSANRSAPALTHRFTTPATPTTGGTTATTTTAAASAASTPAAAAAAAAEARQAASAITGVRAGTVVAGSTTTGAATTVAATGAASDAGTVSNPIQLADLQTFLQGMTGVAAGGGATGSGGGTEPAQSVDLSTFLTGDALSGIINNTKAAEQLQTHLPATDGSVEEQLRSTLQSPQFQQAVSQFSSALESGQLAPVVSQLVTNPDAVSAAKQGNMQEFLKALENGKESSTTSGTAAATAACSTPPKEEGGDKANVEKKEETKKEEKEDDSMQLD